LMPARSGQPPLLRGVKEGRVDGGPDPPVFRPPLRHRAAPLQLAVLSLLAALSVLLLAALLSVWLSAVLNALHQPAAKCFMGIAATAITPIAATIGVPGITGPTTTAISGRFAPAFLSGP